MTLGERLKAILRFKGLQQKDLAKGIKVNECIVSRWCKGITTPKVRNLTKIALFLNVSLNALIGGEELLDRLLERYESGLIA